MPFKNITGVVFGRLTAIKSVGFDKYKKTLWLCKCECGNDKTSPIGSLMSGNTKSCGCGKHIGFSRMVEERKKNAFGIYHTRARSSWHHMIRRCENPADKHFKDYGGRGISVCERWKDLRTFVADMGDPPEGMTLDRWPDMNGNYEPGNCRWATPKQQAQNTRRNVMADFNGENLCLSEIADRIGMKKSTLYARAYKAMRDVEARIGTAKATPMAVSHCEQIQQLLRFG
jgi:hypothetical protein